MGLGRRHDLRGGLIMFNERVLEFEGGAFIPCRKGAQARN
jgi:hypothetical protein